MFVKCWHMSLSSLSCCFKSSVLGRVTSQAITLNSICFLHWSILSINDDTSSLILTKLCSPVSTALRSPHYWEYCPGQGWTCVQCTGRLYTVQWTWNVPYLLPWQQRMSLGNMDPHNSSSLGKNILPQANVSSRVLYDLNIGSRAGGWIAPWSLTCDEDISSACQGMVRVSQPRIVSMSGPVTQCRPVITPAHPLLSHLFAKLISDGMWTTHQECPAPMTNTVGEKIHSNNKQAHRK